jgi:hypothetical protein
VTKTIGADAGLYKRLMDDFSRSPKVQRLLARYGIDGVVAIGYWTLVLCETQTGDVDAETLLARFPTLDPGKLAPMLVEVGLWDELTPSSWAFHDFPDYQPNRVNRFRSERGGKARAATAERVGGRFAPKGATSAHQRSTPALTSAPHQRSDQRSTSAPRSEGPALTSAHQPDESKSRAVSELRSLTHSSTASEGTSARGFREAMAAAGFDPFWEDRPSREPSPGEDDVLLAASFPEEDPYGDP